MSQRFTKLWVLYTVRWETLSLKQAKDYHDRALTIMLKTFGPDHVNVAACYNRLGLVHRELGDLKQAKDYHDRALAIMLKELGSDHVNVA